MSPTYTYRMTLDTKLSDPDEYAQVQEAIMDAVAGAVAELAADGVEARVILSDTSTVNATILDLSTKDC